MVLCVGFIHMEMWRIKTSEKNPAISHPRFHCTSVWYYYYYHKSQEQWSMKLLDTSTGITVQVSGNSTTTSPQNSDQCNC